MKKDKLSLQIEILREIFNIAPKRFQEKDLDSHYLATKFHISGKELKDNIDFLVETGLIQRFPGDSYKQDRIFGWLIKEKGLDYLEKKEGEKRQEEFNKIVAFTGGIIALTTIYTFLVNSIKLEDYPKTYWTITPIFLLLVIVCLGPLVTFIINFFRKEVLRIG